MTIYHPSLRKLKRGSLVILKKEHQVSWAFITGRDSKKKFIEVGVTNWKVRENTNEIYDMKSWNTQIKYSLMSNYLETAQVFF
jgi:hypothetical protein